MRMQRTSNKVKKKSNFKLYVNIFILMVVLASIAIYFSNGDFNYFLRIFLMEAGGTLVFVLVLLFLAVSRMNSKKKPKHTGEGKSNFHNNTIEKNLQVMRSPFPTKTNQRKVIKLNQKKFNWSDEEIIRNTKRVEEEVVPAKEEFIPYRSPFEPINPPKKVHKDAEINRSLIEHSIHQGDNMEKKRCGEYKDDLTRGSQEERGWENEHHEGVKVEEETDSENNGNQLGLYSEEREETVDGESQRDSNLGLSSLADLLREASRSDGDVSSHNDKPMRKIKSISIKEKKNSDYKSPPLELLNINEANREGKVISLYAQQNATKLERTLRSFRIEAKVINICQGPTVTRYELQPNVGVKVSKIVNLADDIALNLAAKDVRIEAPIPGKAAIGIEVPNKEVVPVFLSEVIASEEFQNHPSGLVFALGKDIAGNNVVADIAKMPHLLIAGATGSGKSVCINTLITSILYKASPEEVRLLMIDPKVVELSIYNGIPHLLIPVVTDPKKAAGALNWAVQEMTRRYQLFADNNVRDIKGYNLLMQENEAGSDKLPQIVIIIDELADLMMAAPSEVEDSVCRLAQMARAAGMHLVIATQRPSVDVITGVIKANIPSRISFAVSSQVDSRTILDMAGAEKLLGKGDMLFSPMGQSKPIRVQGAFISDNEVEAVVSYIKSNVEVEYEEDIIDNIEGQIDPGQGSIDEEDELLPQAIELALERGQASASLMQRKFRIGYARAARILDQMEALGVVSGYDGSKPRDVLITKEEWEELNM